MGLLGKLRPPRLAHEDPHTLGNGKQGPTTNPSHRAESRLPAETLPITSQQPERVVLCEEAAETSATLTG